MHVLITRSTNDTEALFSGLVKLGCQVSSAPLLDIVYCDIPGDALVSASALVVTSRNGLRALSRAPALGQAVGLPLYAVGEATANLARSLGFRNVVAGQGKASDLIPLLKALPAAQTRGVVHLAGDHVAFDLQKALPGLKIRQIPAYRSVAAKTLPPAVCDDIRTGGLDAVILMSPRTAATWIDAVRSAIGTLEVLRPIRHLCLSDAVAHALELAAHEPSETAGNAETLKIDVAARPTVEEVLALTGRLAEHSK